MELEITESAVMADTELAMVILRRLSDMGIQLSIDDFGTGHSSLAYIKLLPVHEIKIDKSFVMSMGMNTNDIMIVNTAIDLGHNLGLSVVAEGVENKETYDRLTNLGCNVAQGYFMSRPLPAAQLMSWIAESPWGLKKEECSESEKGEGKNSSSPLPSPFTLLPHIRCSQMKKISQNELAIRIQEEIPTLPTVVTRILNIVLDDKSSVKDISEVVRVDQALVSKVLRVVNSAAYGLREKVSTVDHAMTILGFDTLKKLFLCLSIFDNLSQENQAGYFFQKSQFWCHSLAVATVARGIALLIKYPSPNEAYVAGLMHDVGKIIIEQIMPEEYHRLYEKDQFEPGYVSALRRRKPFRKSCLSWQTGLREVEPSAHLTESC